MITIFIFMSFFIFTLFTFYLFDRVIKWEYINYKKCWIADGKPIGFFWVPKESKTKFLGIPKLTSSNARSRYALYWIFTTPEWTKGDSQATRLLFEFRLFALITVLCSLFWIGFVLFK